MVRSSDADGGVAGIRGAIAALGDEKGGGVGALQQVSAGAGKSFGKGGGGGMRWD